MALDYFPYDAFGILLFWAHKNILLMAGSTEFRDVPSNALDHASKSITLALICQSTLLGYQKLDKPVLGRSDSLLQFQGKRFDIFLFHTLVVEVNNFVE